MGKPIDIVGVTNFIERFYTECGPHQWARELLKNSIEAGATKVEFKVDRESFKTEHIFRRIVCDNGHGMDDRELTDFFQSVGRGSKTIKGMHNNFGMGAKVSTLPWNPNGVVVISYKNGVGNMLWVHYNPRTEQYELAELIIDGERSIVAEPGLIDGFDWSKIKPDWITDHGTIVVLMGSNKNQNTIFGESGKDSSHTLTKYLNDRFWDLSTLDIKVEEVDTTNLAKIERMSDAMHYRKIHGAKHFITNDKTDGEKIKQLGTSSILSGKVRVNWYLKVRDRDIRWHARESGYIAIKYQDEIFVCRPTSPRSAFRLFGISEPSVQANLVIIIEPRMYGMDGMDWGVHPNQSRNMIVFTGDNKKSIEIPLDDWGSEFASNMPQEIVDALNKASEEKSNTITDDTYRERLKYRLGGRWDMDSTKESLTTVRGESHVSMIPGEVAGIYKAGTPGVEGGKTHKANASKSVSTIPKTPLAESGGKLSGSKKNVGQDVPRYEIRGKEFFEKDYLAAQWDPKNINGPTVFINRDCPIITSSTKFHQSHFHKMHMHEVETVVHGVYGEVAVAKVAHMQKYSRFVIRQDLDSVYRTGEALTTALSGFLTEDVLIEQRLNALKITRSK